MSHVEHIVECVPNFSEGRDAHCVLEIVQAMHVAGVHLLDFSMDADHNRSVVTVAGTPDAVREAAVRAVGRAAELIDLTKQTGEHPRIGAADVVPFVPVRGIRLEQCALLARQAGAEIWKRYKVPSYFYEAAASRPDRALLEDVRKGQFEGLREAAMKDASRRPDVGGPGLHPTAGASAVGARRFLVAYNIYLDTADVSVARTVAKQIRASGGGMAGVKAMGVLVHGRAQVSLNITDYKAAPVGDVYQRVKGLAERQGARPVAGEIIGLIPQDAWVPESEWARQIEGFVPEEKILELRLEHPLAWPA
jgi:glutamate formiminotransferase